MAQFLLLVVKAIVAFVDIGIAHQMWEAFQVLGNLVCLLTSFEKLEDILLAYNAFAHFFLMR